ncbi:SDR family oxidoreductase [Saccharopolyspora sp. NPDC003752]
MRIAVAGATGNIGARTVSFLEREGHVVVRISRSLGVDLITGRGLDAALEGVDAVVDAISSPPISAAETRDYFGTTTRNLLAAEERGGVRHHVLWLGHFDGPEWAERRAAEITTALAARSAFLPVVLKGPRCGSEPGSPRPRLGCVALRSARPARCAPG